MKVTQNRRLVLSLVLMTGLVALLAGCGRGKDVGATARQEPAAAPVIVDEVRTRRVEISLEEVGTLKARQEVTVRSELAGKIEAIPFEEGAPVAAGDVLVQLDTEAIRADIQSLEAQIEQLNVRLANRERNLARNRPLLEKELIPPLQFDNLQAEVDEIRAQVAQAEAALAKKKVELADATIRAPFAGVAGERTVSPGDYLRAGEEVVTVVDLDSLEIAFQVPEKHKPTLGEGQTVAIQVAAHGDRTFQGEIFFIAPQVDPATRTFRVKARVANEARLLNPGMFARVRVVIDTFPQALTVPWESVIQTEEGTYLYTVAEGRTARRVPVRLGKVTAEWAQILEADILPGTPVILEGKYAVNDGAAVAIQSPAAASGGEG